MILLSRVRGERGMTNSDLLAGLTLAVAGIAYAAVTGTNDWLAAGFILGIVLWAIIRTIHIYVTDNI